MPATEQTWRTPSLMHMVFGITSLVMLAATVLTFYADYRREWKNVQRQTMRVENGIQQYRITEAETLAFAQTASESRSAWKAAQQSPPDEKLVAEFQSAVQAFVESDAQRVDSILKQLPRLGSVVDVFDPPSLDKIKTALGTVTNAQSDEQGEARAELIEVLQEFIRRARFRENDLARKRKFHRAELDVARSDFELLIRDDQPQEAVDLAKGAYDQIAREVDDGLTPLYQAANEHRKQLERILAEIVAGESAARDKYLKQVAEVEKLRESHNTRTSPLRNVLTLPILDAFMSPLKIRQIWLPELTLNNNFIEVARFDRCTTCHLGIDQTAPGSAVDPAYPGQRTLTITLATPATAPQLDSATPASQPATEAELSPSLADADASKGPLELTPPQREDKLLAVAYGLVLAEEGLLRKDDVTVAVIYPESAAARAMFRVGDVIEFVADARLNSREIAMQQLLRSVEWGRPLKLTVRRGLPHPFATHPRLDLFVGSLSPHKAEQFGCTICHEGQGSATEFKWASHTPNTMNQHEAWSNEYGWFDNHHWIQPMYSKRFAEASCLKCHHDVVELEASPRFPEAPAPRVVEGYHTIREYGCYGCHEVNGYDGPNQRIGPDMRVEPSYAAAAQQLLADRSLPATMRVLAESLVRDPENRDARRKLMQYVAGDAVLAAARRAAAPVAEATTAVENNADEENNESAAPAGPILSRESHKMATVLEDIEVPGKLRKPGPSLRYVGSKLGREFLYQWIANPFDFRPDTRMPRFFGQWSHLGPDEHGRDHLGPDDHGRDHLGPDDHGRDHLGDKDHGLALSGARGAGTIHPVSARSDEESLADDASRFEPIEVRAATEYLLHASQRFEYLSPPAGITAKPSAERGKRLFQLRGCLACHQHGDFPEAKDTQGPNLSRIGAKLSLEGENGRKWLYSWVREPSRYHARTKMPDVFLLPIKVGEELTDPAADVTAYLITSQGWDSKPLPRLNSENLVDLARLHLRDKFTQSLAERYLRRGIPESEAAEMKGDETLLSGETSDDNRDQKLLLYVGRRTLAKYGCAGCHDIPGFEDSKPIGTGLADWARKDIHQLAFEQVSRYIAHRSDFSSKVTSHDEHHHEVNVRDLPEDTGIMLHALLNHHREGFLWQKLREPRSYDYKKTENKGYNERLRMPKFAFNEAQVGAVSTFVMGLVGRPPTSKFVYRPKGPQAAIVRGRQVLEKYNCGGCHKLDVEKFSFEYDPKSEDFATERPLPVGEYEIFRPNFTPKELLASRAVDVRGMGRATVTATEVRDAKTGQVMIGADEDDNPIQYLELWRPAVINGQPRMAKEQLTLRPQWITHRYPAVGGDLANLIQPAVLEIERKSNPNFGYDDALSWVPPPLIHEGYKVRPEWLHAFLLDPYPIRPAAMLRMPKFNMSAAEASALVDYFRAVDGVDQPYEFDLRTTPENLATAEAQFEGRMDDALKIVTNGNFCVKCHLVGDYEPKGTDRAKGPQLAKVGERLRPEYLERWLANPARLLPYTKMPVNFDLKQTFDPSKIPEGGPLIQQGTTHDRLEAVTDFLLQYNAITRNSFEIKSRVVEVAPAAAEGGGNPPADQPEEPGGERDEEPEPVEKSNQ